MADPMEIEFSAANDRFDDDDPRWREQVADLTDELRREVDRVWTRRTPTPGAKGAVDSVVMLLGSAGVFTAAVEVLRIWVSRDKHRSVTLTFSGPDGVRQSVQVSADNAGSQAMASLVEVAAAALAADRQ